MGIRRGYWQVVLAGLLAGYFLFACSFLILWRPMTNGTDGDSLPEVTVEATALVQEENMPHTKNPIILTSRDLLQPRREMSVQATAYTHTGNTTFTGVYPHVGTVAVDPALIPLGSRLWIEGYGYGIAQDTGGAIKGHRIDLFMDTKAECLNWGRRTVKIYILE